MVIIDRFADNICSKCLVCQPAPDPGFCATNYAGNKERFWKLLTYILVRKHDNPSFVNELFTFMGFCGIFCNSKVICPQYSHKECSKLGTRMDCYDAFLGQSGAEILPGTKAKIYGKFSGIDINTIGRSEYSLQIGDPLLLDMPKKKRKKIKKTVRKAMADMEGKVKHKKKNKKPKKKVSTMFFCNDDKEWKAQIDLYLAK